MISSVAPYVLFYWIVGFLRRPCTQRIFVGSFLVRGMFLYPYSCIVYWGCVLLWIVSIHLWPFMSLDTLHVGLSLTFILFLLKILTKVLWLMKCLILDLGIPTDIWCYAFVVKCVKPNHIKKHAHTMKLPWKILCVQSHSKTTTHSVKQYMRRCNRGCHHHHHVVLVARISLTPSRHSSLSFIALGRSSGQHPVSSHSCWMYVRAGRPAFARPCVGVHKSTSLMSSSLLLQQCPACLVRLTWIVFVIGGRWPYSWCLVGCCRQDLKQRIYDHKHSFSIRNYSTNTSLSTDI